MLFDERVAGLLREHFLCVITDAPWSQVSHRNAATWEEVESWKSAPRNSEIVFVTSADKRDRRGLVYRHFTEPAQLAAVLEEIAIEDGRIEAPAALRDRLAVVNRLRARCTALRRSLHDALGDRARPALQELDAFLAGVQDTDLCPEDRAAALHESLLADTEKDRARLAAEVDELRGKVPKRPADAVLRAIDEGRERRSADFEDVTGLTLLRVLLAKRAGSQ